MNKMNKFKGFTLVEMIIVISISSVLISSGIMLFSNIANNYVTIQRFNNLATEAEQSILLFTKEVRAAQSISSGTNSTISFIKANGTPVNYRLNGTNFQRGEGSAYNNINALVSSFTLTYFDANLNELSMPLDASQVRLVTVTLNFSQDINSIQLVETTYLINS